MKFSIIVPVYNVERYLHESIDSVLEQDFKNFELLLCDDGSSDGSGGICDDYAEKDSRVKVVHLKNGGPSAARNAGLSVANGDYIFFFDSDDRMCEGILQKISGEIDKMNNPDAIIGTFLNWDGDNAWPPSDISAFVNGQEDKNILELNEMYAVADVQLPWCVYQCIVRREILNRNNLTFDVATNSAEDADFYMRMIRHIHSYRLLDTPFVLYRVGRAGSIVTELKFKAYYGEMTFIARLYGSVDGFPHPQIMRHYFADEFTDRVMKVARLKGDEKAAALALIKNNWNITRNTTHKMKFRVAKLLWTVLGVFRGSQVLYALWSQKNKKR